MTPQIRNTVKRMIYLLISLLVIILLSGIGLSVRSHKGTAPGLIDGKLAPCLLSTNCVCSEYPVKSGYTDALVFFGDAQAAWKEAVQAVRATGGTVVSQNDDYLAAIYSSRFFRFIDDVELRLDPMTKKIHVRSSSRVGRTDFGVNARRVEHLRDYYMSISENSNNSR